MKIKILIVSTLNIFLFGCANPINKVTFQNYQAECSAFEGGGNLTVAEEACRRAVINTDWGNLGPELKSQSLYNLGRIERKLSKFAESERLLKESLSIEEQLEKPDQIKIGRRLVELSVSLAAQNKWQEGAKFLLRVLPESNNFSGSERTYVIEVLNHFGSQFRTLNQEELAIQFELKAKELKK